jgi:predicted hydrolase (HD superfamily)
MRYYANIKDADPDEWGKIGLIHDLDYEQFPDAHCHKAKEILTAEGWPEEAVRAVMAHGWGEVTDVEPETELEKTLFAVDELTGFISACALVRPSRSVDDLEVKSIKKKWKSPAFAAGVDRGLVEKGAAMMGLSIEELMEGVLKALQENSEDLGL